MSTDNDYARPFFAVGGLSLAVGLLNYFFLVESPEEEVNSEKKKPNKIRFLKALQMPGIIVFSISFFFIKLTSYGIYYWYPTYLQEDLSFTKSEALDIFKLFSTGSFVGNILMGCVSDLLPMRSPIFELGILVSTIMMYLVTIESSGIYTLTFILGGALTGATIIIAAIECDIGVYVSKKYDQEALGTFSGMIDGFASLGSVVG